MRGMLWMMMLQLAEAMHIAPTTMQYLVYEIDSDTRRPR
jgi:hypothetical protein